MGYCNKRKRSKRRRTRTLQAIQNNNKVYLNGSSGEDSSLDVLDHGSKSSTFRSTHSFHSNGNSDFQPEIPNSIFLDAVTISNLPDINQNSNLLLNTSDIDQYSILDPEDVDDLFQHPDLSVDDHQSSPGDDTLHSNSSSLDNFSNSGQSCFHSSEYQHHRFDQVTEDESASYQIMSLLDSAGAPRICYNRLVALLKKLTKKHGFDIQRALNRETLMKRLATKYKSRPKIQSTMINEQVVFRFKFNEMLQDLVHSSSKHLHEILPCQDEYNNPEAGSEHELWNTAWMKNTFALDQYKDFDAQNDIMLPVILYMDKTGTDVNQRYSLEPVLFSVAAIPRQHRESRHSWRHLGFVPQKTSTLEEESLSSLQIYHDCLSYLLDGLREAQQNPPILTVQYKGRDFVRRRAFLPLMIVMGDQLSQDTLCGRLKSNSGGAGRVHRSCMCSYLNIDDPYHACKSVNIATLNLLTTYAMNSEENIDLQVSSKHSLAPNTKESRITKSFLMKQRTMFRSILRHPFTTHPIKNSFNEINFGAWTSGIHDATVDDFMHSVEGGMVSYITETVYDGLTKKEKESIEELTRPLLSQQRCSVIANYPRWRLQPGFTRQTLMTSGERVGSVLALCLSLQDPTIRATIQSGHRRQIQKYLDLSPGDSESIKQQTSPPPLLTEFYLDQHMHTLEDKVIRHTLEHMVRHGFDISLIDDLDMFQINQLVWHCTDMFKNVQYPDNYPSDCVDGSYIDMGESEVVPEKQFQLVKHAFRTKPSKLLKSHRRRKVEGTVGKHLMKKPNKKGEGSSAAILTDNMGTFVIFLEYVLCYHAFCKYSWSLPVFLQRSYDNIKAGNRFVVEYFQKLIYRGNATVDSRFPKIHAQTRMGLNTQELNSVMNFCCETGERLLKTEAKGISKTAQQRGNATFLTQTMSRLQDRLVLDCFAKYLERKESSQESAFTEPVDHVARASPHFVYDVDRELIYAMSRKNIPQSLDDKSGSLSSEIIKALKKHEPGMQIFEIYNEVVLRDNSRLRASPNYANSGPWYDFANVSWERVINDVPETYLLPAKCLCFFRKKCPESGFDEIMALIHTVDETSEGKCPGRPDTLLTKSFLMQYNNKKEPVTHVIPVASLDSCIRCIPHIPSKRLFDVDSPGITCLLPRNHWAYMWMALNDLLKEYNSIEKMQQRKGKLVALCGKNWLGLVRERYKKYLDATCSNDLT